MSQQSTTSAIPAVASNFGGWCGSEMCVGNSLWCGLSIISYKLNLLQGVKWLNH